MRARAVLVSICFLGLFSVSSQAQVTPPTIWSLEQHHCPDYHISVYGDNFQNGIQVFAGGTPVSVTWVSLEELDLTGGDSLLALLPVGVAVPVRFLNPDSGEITVPFTRTENPPEITVQPQSVSVPYGQPAYFWVMASGAGWMCFQWYLGESGDYSTPVGEDSDSYITPPVTAATPYWVLVSADAGRTESQTAWATVCAPTCSASADPTSGLEPLTVSFTSSVTATGCSGIPTYAWDFGDGATSTLQNPTHTYTAPGTFGWYVNITVNDVTCTKNGLITVTSLPCELSCTASASVSSGDAPLSVTFTATAEILHCSWGPEFFWEFGDYFYSNEQNPVHVYYGYGTYSWRLTVYAEGQTCVKEGTITATGTSSLVVGEILIEMADYSANWPLRGAGIQSARVKAHNVATGQDYLATPNADAFYHFDGIPQGTYLLSATVVYTDYVSYDASLLTYGCPAPPGGVILKEVTSVPREIQVAGTQWESAPFPVPLVLVHGSLSCYEKWYSDDPLDPNNSLYWDNYARSQGFFTFTPNYQWQQEVPWCDKASQILDQVGQDMIGLIGVGAENPLSYALAGYEMGGLVARVLFSGSFRDDPRVWGIYYLFLLGTPNSGTELLFGGGPNTILGTNTITRRFNEVYPDFGWMTQYADVIGGNNGWWRLKNTDGRVPIASAFNISKLACSSVLGFPLCKSYPSVTFDSGPGHIYFLTHAELGSPPSTQSVLNDNILPWITWEGERASACGLQRPAGSRPISRELLPVDPESPAGAIGWGSNSRTTGSASGSLAGFRAPSVGEAQSYPFDISISDGMGLLVLVTQGSGLFEVFDPDGNLVASRQLPSLPGAQAEADFAFSALNPEAGAWNLKVTPNSEGVSFSAVGVENSPFGINAYIPDNPFQPSEIVLFRLDLEGDLAGVIPASVAASLYGPDGTSLIESVPLFDDGAHQDGAPGDGYYGGAATAPSSPGGYPVVFRAMGTSQGTPFAREAFEILSVLPSQHLFTGNFTDSAQDLDGDGLDDALSFTAQVAFAAPGCYTMSADLYDSSGIFLAHSTVEPEISSAGVYTPSMNFFLVNTSCSQFGLPFYVKNLQIVSETDFTPADAWQEAVATDTYEASSFQCSTGPPLPSLSSLRPDEVVRGRTLDLLVGGSGFRAGVLLAFDAGIAVNSLTRLTENLILANITVSPSATLGFHSLMVTNPGGGSAVRQNALEVKEDQPPAISLQSPSDGATVEGAVAVSASASDDVRVVEVAFQLNGATQFTDTLFPFRWEWDSTSGADGQKTVTAIAKDTAGNTATATPVTVTVRNSSLPGDCDGNGAVSIGEVQKAINMFLGIQAVACGVDCNGDGSVSIGEVQKVINAFLGVTNSC